MSAVTPEAVAAAAAKAAEEHRLQEAQWAALFFAAGRAAEALANGDTTAAKHWLDEASEAEGDLLGECEIVGPLLDAMEVDP